MQRIAIPDSAVINGRILRGFHALPRHEAERLHAGLVTQANSCGSNAGAIGALVSASLYLLVGVGLPILMAVPISVTWWLGIVVTIGGGAAGKGIGVWWAHRHFEALCREFEELVNNPAPARPHAVRNTDPTGDISHG